MLASERLRRIDVQLYLSRRQLLALEQHLINDRRVFIELVEELTGRLAALEAALRRV